VCGGPAVTIVRYAKLRLCKEHFIEFIQGRVLRCIERYRLIEGGWRVLVAVSGGKDSTALLHILSVISRRLGFNVLALHLDLGIPDYSRKAREVVESFCRGLEVPLIVVDLKELLGVGLPELVVRAVSAFIIICNTLIFIDV
jgi:tRNA(Ile)-lysidine synthase TilS/MesJ